MKQTARELINCDDGFLNDKKYLIMDRDTKFCESFRSVLQQSGVAPVILPRAKPEFELAPGKILRVTQIRVPGPPDTVRRSIPAERM